jgi:hypothetical protein
MVLDLSHLTQLNNVGALDFNGVQRTLLLKGKSVMAMRHKPIHPKRGKPPKGQRRGAGQHTAYLSPDQQEALTKFQKDFSAAYPKIVETQAVAQRIFQEFLDQPEWRIGETELPPGTQRPAGMPEAWSVGHAKVNIEDNREGAEGDSQK